MNDEKSQKMREKVNIIGPLKPKMSSVDPSVFTIFVDGGAKYKTQDFKKSISIGDNDSGQQFMDILLPKAKNQSDLACALKELSNLENLSPNPTVKLYGFMGGRLDHQLLLLGDLAAFAKTKTSCFMLYEEGVLRMEIKPTGEWEFNYKGEFSIFTFEASSVLYQGDCEYPTDKEYPQQLHPFSSQGLSNVSNSSFKLKNQGVIGVYYVPKTSGL